MVDHLPVTTGDLLLILLLTDLQASVGLVLVMAITEGIATLPRMAMWALDQTLAAAAPQTGCRQHHLVPVIGFRFDY